MSRVCADNPTGVPGCDEPEAVYIEWDDRDGLGMAALLCHRHAAMVRAGQDPWGHGDYAALPYTVTSWRSAADSWTSKVLDDVL